MCSPNDANDLALLITHLAEFYEHVCLVVDVSGCLEVHRAVSHVESGAEHVFQSIHNLTVCGAEGV